MGGLALSYSAVGQFRPWYVPGAFVTGLYIDDLTTGIHGIKSYGSIVNVSACYVANATDGIQNMEAGTLTIGDYFEVHATGCTGYTLRMGAASRCMVKPSLTSAPGAAATGQIVWEQAAGAAWPAAGASANDGHGAYVSRE